MAPQTNSSDKRSKLSFLSLPREIRDQVYAELLITSNCIAYTRTHGIDAFDKRIEPNVHLLQSRWINKQIAQEATEFFYQNNTFRLDCDILPKLLDSKHFVSTHQSRLLSPRIYGAFEAAAWVRRLIVRTELSQLSDGGDYPVNVIFEQKIRILFKCPRLQNVVLDLQGPSGMLQLDTQAEEAMRKLKMKLGSGLKVYHDMGWSYGSPGASSDWRVDISGRFAESDKTYE